MLWFIACLTLVGVTLLWSLLHCHTSHWTLQYIPHMKTIDNKYKRWHDQLIAKRQTTPASGVVERHHILPRSLGGDNSPSNLVDLTPREHLAVHCMLARFTEGEAFYKMLHASQFMMRTKRMRKLRRWREYDRVRRELAALGMSDEARRKIGDVHRGKRMSAESRRKMSEAQKHIMSDPEARRRRSEAGKRALADPEIRRKMSEASKGRPKSIETRRRLSEANKGKPKSAEHRRKLSEANKGKSRPFSAEHRRNLSKAQKRRLEDPEIHRQLVDATTRQWADPEIRRKMSDAIRGKRRTAEQRRTMSEAQKRRFANANDNK